MSKEHWQKIYNTKDDNQVSWTQVYPSKAIDYLIELDLTKDSKIIDIGGGSSRFPDALLELGFTDITVLDISQAALSRSQKRLGINASKVKWVVTDILNFTPLETFDFWYDRAVFHFLIQDKDIESYIRLASRSIHKNGHLLIGTFSEVGPLKCSGLEVSRYSAHQLENRFSTQFDMDSSFREQHLTPFETIQEFQFCGFTNSIRTNSSM